MTAYFLSPIFGSAQQAFDNQGAVLAGGLLYTYVAGTTTPAETYTDATATVANSNPLVFNSAGRLATQIWLAGGTGYKFILKDSAGTVIGTWDNISGINSSTGYAYSSTTATQGQTVFTSTNAYTVGASGIIVYTNGKKESLTLDYTETNSTSITFGTGKVAGDIVEIYTGISLPVSNQSALLGSAVATMTAGTGKTTLYTVPTGKSAVITQVVVRQPSATLSGGTSFSFGSGAGADTWKQTVDLSTMTAATDYMVITPLANVKYTLEAAAATFGVTTTTGSTGAATATIDVYGYLV